MLRENVVLAKGLINVREPPHLLVLKSPDFVESERLPNMPFAECLFD